MKTYAVANELGLEKVAGELWREIQGVIHERGVILALVGPLGVGKTRLVKLLAREMGITGGVHSPTFVLHQSYHSHGEMSLEHIDTWRMEKEKELMELGISELVRTDAVVAIEWAEKTRGVINDLKNRARVIWIKLSYSPVSETGRLIEVGGEMG